MELKPGYKRTEVGIIPEDWEVKRLEEVADIRSGGTPSTANASFWNGGILWCTPTDITALEGRKYLTDTSRKITAHGLKFSSAEIVPANSVVMTSRATIGECAINKIPLSTNQGFKNFIPFDSISAEFLFYLLQTKKQNFISLCGGSTFLEINKTQLAGFQVGLPAQKVEQEAIAEALSDADALIESLEQLIAKKRHVKQGAMQELLRPKAEWESKFVAEVADCLDNLRIPLNDSQRTKMQGDYPYCGANGVLDHINNFCVNDSVILMAEDGGYFDEYATRPIAYRMSGKFWVNNHAHILKSKANFDQDFLFYSLVHKNIQSFLASGTRAKLNKSEMNKIVIDSPAVKSEQNAIAAILSDMDAEIAALEARRDKARRIKQGMMQELLTGQTRLV